MNVYVELINMFFFININFRGFFLVYGVFILMILFGGIFFAN